MLSGARDVHAASMVVVRMMGRAEPVISGLLPVAGAGPLQAGMICAMLPKKMLPNTNHWGRRQELISLLLVVWAAICSPFGGAPAYSNLVIQPTFDSTITSDPDAAVIEATINSVIALYEANFS